MNRVLAFTLVLFVSFSFGFASSAQASPLPARAENAEKIVVVVESEHLTDNHDVGVRLKVELQGDDPSSLIGEGRAFCSCGPHNYFPATGSINGAVVTLSGIFTDSSQPFLIGSPVTVVADSTTGQITFTFGPYAGGPFVGQIGTWTGTGKVKIKGAD